MNMYEGDFVVILLFLHMRRTFPEPCYFHFLIFYKNGFIEVYSFYICFGKQNYMRLTASPGIIVYKKNWIFGVTFN